MWWLNAKHKAKSIVCFPRVSQAAAPAGVCSSPTRIHAAVRSRGNYQQPVQVGGETTNSLYRWAGKLPTASTGGRGNYQQPLQVSGETTNSLYRWARKLPIASIGGQGNYKQPLQVGGKNYLQSLHVGVETSPYRWAGKLPTASTGGRENSQQPPQVGGEQPQWVGVGKLPTASPKKKNFY